MGITIPVILGPTAVGKSALTLELARELKGEIISLDSRQIYTGMNIGTAKPTVSELTSVPHHLIDIIHPDIEFSAGEWARQAESTIEDCFNRDVLPIICGGTFFYFQVLSEGLQNSFPADFEFRKTMIALEESETGILHRMLCERVPQKAEKIHAHDIYRLIRALQNHRDMEELERGDTPSGEKCYSFMPIVLERERSLLYDRINQRVDLMVEHGLFEEFSQLLENGYDANSPGLKCVGYREFFNYIASECAFNEAIEKIKQNTRKFAKRQLTWLRNKINTELKIQADSIDMKDSIHTIKSRLNR